MEKHFDVQGRLRIFDAFLAKYDADVGTESLTAAQRPIRLFL
jgi:hypothetical protein